MSQTTQFFSFIICICFLLITTCSAQILPSAPLCDFSTTDFRVENATMQGPYPEYVTATYWLGSGGELSHCQTPIGTRLVIPLSVVLSRAYYSIGPHSNLTFLFQNVSFVASSLILVTEDAEFIGYNSSLPVGEHLLHANLTASMGLNITIIDCFFDGRSSTVAQATGRMDGQLFSLSNTWHTTQFLLFGSFYPVHTSITIARNRMLLIGANNSYSADLPSGIDTSTYEAITSHCIRFGIFNFSTIATSTSQNLVSGRSPVTVAHNSVTVSLQIANFTMPKTPAHSLPFSSVLAFGLCQSAFASQALIVGNLFNVSTMRVALGSGNAILDIPANGTGFEIDTVALLMDAVELGTVDASLIITNNTLIAAASNPYGGSLFGLWIDGLWAQPATSILNITQNNFLLTATVTSPCETVGLQDTSTIGGSGVILVHKNRFLVDQNSNLTITQWPVSVFAMNFENIPAGANSTTLCSENIMHILTYRGKRK